MNGLIVAGMHRSGTSLMTRLLVAGGWQPGETVPTVGGEQYAENARFVALHRAWLEACLPAGDGHRDWGISSGGPIDLEAIAPTIRTTMSTDATGFIDQRDRCGERWVAKDPRATLFLPVWGGFEPLRFVLIYRNPWDVVDSAVRLGAEVFCRRPRLAVDAWLDHNRRLIDFARAHRERCVIVASERLVLDPVGTWEAMGVAFGLEGDLPADLLDPDRYVHRDESHPIAALWRDAHPAHCALLDELDGLADIPRAPGPPVHATGRRRAVPGGTLPPGTGVQAIVPCRNDGDFLLEAVASVDSCAEHVHAASGRERVELTVIDDGSTDAETLRLLERLRATGRHVLSISSTGLAGARNAARAASATCAVIPVDADNRLRPSLVEALDRIERDEADIVHGPWQRFGMDRARVDPPAMTLESLVPKNPIDACALVSRRLLDRLGGWDPELRFWEDWNLWLGAVGIGARIHRLDDVTFHYLVRPGALASMADSDPGARARVVERITTTHAHLLGPTLARLVETVHHLESMCLTADAGWRATEESYRELEAQHLGLESTYRELEADHLALETAYRELESAYRALEADHLARGD